jgi:hypothetical protein
VDVRTALASATYQQLLDELGTRDPENDDG